MTHAGTHQLAIPRADTGSLAEQAAEWCAYLYSGQDTEEGRRQFACWLNQSDAHIRTYAEVEQWWRDLDYGLSAAGQTPGAAGSKLSPFPNRRKSIVSGEEPDSRLRGNDSSRRPVWAIPLALAATFLLAIGISLLQPSSSPPVAPAIPYSSGTGQVKTVELSDGSRVTLGGESAIQARLTADIRVVEVTRGGAYFDVASDKDRLFLVRAATTEIRVVGTQFDVLKGSENVRISVAEGKVDVTQNSERKTQNPAGGVRLTKGQQVTAKHDGTLGSVQPFNAESALAWREGRLEYQDTRLADVIAEVNRYRQQKITLLDKALGETRITIAMPIDKTDRLLTGLAASSPVEIDRTAFGVTVKKRENAR